MLNDTTRVINYSKPQKTVERYNFITEELLTILDSSPKAFVYILKLACSNAFNLSEEDAFRIIDDLSERVPQSELELALGSIDNSTLIELKKRPEISTDVIQVLDEDGFQLAALLARHTYGDMSETSDDQALLNDIAVKTGSGTYVTSYKQGDFHIRVSTNLPSYQTILELR
ncbi:hypothetical protein ACTT7V_003245 [Escherichia coli]